MLCEKPIGRLENMSDANRGEAEPLLGDALDQARAIELLYRSAAA